MITQANLLQFFEDRNNIICIDEQEETQSTEFLAPLDYKKIHYAIVFLLQERRACPKEC